VIQENWILSVIEKLDLNSELKYSLHEIMQIVLEQRDDLSNTSKDKKKIQLIQQDLLNVIERRLKNFDFKDNAFQVKIAHSTIDKINNSRNRGAYKIFEVHLKNFRQFIGDQNVTLSTDQERTITVLKGENGSGKSNFLNAISWCLYGIELIQPANLKLSPILTSHLSKSLAINDQSEVVVETLIGRFQPEIRVSRKMSFKRTEKDEIIQIKSSEKMNVYYFENPTVGWKESTNPNALINKIIPKKFLEFFFFDGEQITKYFSPGGEKDIYDAIQTVTDLKIISKLTDIFESLIRIERQKLARTKPNLQNMVQNMEKNQFELDHHKQLVKSVNEEIEKINQELETINVQLQSSSSEIIQSLKMEQDVRTENISEYKARLRETRSKTNDELMTLLPFALMHQISKNFMNYNKKANSQDILPNDFNTSLIEKILASNRCICGTGLSEESHTILKNFLNQKFEENGENKLMKSALLIQNFYTNHFLSHWNSYEKYTKESLVLEDKLEETEMKLADIASKLKTINDPDISNVLKKQNELSSRRDVLLLKKGEIESICKTLDSELHRAQREMDKELKKSKEFETQQSILDIISVIKEIFDQLHGGLEEFVREKLEILITQYFLELTWKKDTFQKVNLKNNYKIAVLTNSGLDRFPELSAGERQILAYAFIASLTTLSGFEAPIIIDTPLGRISKIPRRNIAASLPNFLRGTQLTFLFTETEFTDDVQLHLKNRIGNEYVMKFDQKLEICEIKEV
jgi:DNA sulfur modification protein DndD